MSEDYLRSRAMAKGVLTHGAGRSAPKSGKIVRWMMNLSEAQVVELTARLSRTLAETSDIEPEKLRQAMIAFAKEMPC